MEWLVNEVNRIVADTAPRDIFGIADAFTAYVSDAPGAPAQPADVTFSEILEARPDTAPESFKPSVDAGAGNNTITVDTSTVTLDASMVGYVYKFTVDGTSFFARVTSVDTTNGTVTFKTKFPAPVSTTDTISFYGGTGAYEAQFSFDTEGERVITVRAPKYGISVSALKIKVVKPKFAVGSDEPTVYANLIG